MAKLNKNTLKNLNCLCCNKELTKPQLKNNNKFCSTKCFGLSEKGSKNPGWKNLEKKCKICENLLSKKQISNKGKYCSTKCRDFAHSKVKKEINCLFCNKPLGASQKNENNKFCSVKCYGLWQKKNKINTGTNNNMYGKRHSEEAKKKMRLRRINDIKNKYGIFFPNYNNKACNWFKFFDKINNTNGQYATKEKEYFVENLGYWLDYINFDMKLIIEWDEKHHKLQKEKDKIRQNQIMQEFPNFEFIRISME